ncbi:MAG: 50S ribosomal protein L21 [Patescibacteria group bacterium]|nr:50S ribosomal protein L21 [Patescibacteria group bacterium]
MFAVVNIGSQQFKVAKGDKFDVKKLQEEEGKKVVFDQVYLVNDGKKVKIGTPLVSGATVEAKVLAQKKDDKITVFKMKPKKRYQITRGHRTHLTEIEITDIKVKAAPKKEKKSE